MHVLKTFRTCHSHSLENLVNIAGRGCYTEIIVSPGAESKFCVHVCRLALIITCLRTCASAKNIPALSRCFHSASFLPQALAFTVTFETEDGWSFWSRRTTRCHDGLTRLTRCLGFGSFEEDFTSKRSVLEMIFLSVLWLSSEVLPFFHWLVDLGTQRPGTTFLCNGTNSLMVNRVVSNLWS